MSSPVLALGNQKLSKGLTVTLYLIGSTVSRGTPKTVGPRPLLQGVLLWVVVAVTSLLMIRRGLIGL